MIIGGKRIKEGKQFDVVNPYTNEIVGKVPDALKEDIATAMNLSFSTKKSLSPEKRADILRKAAKKTKDEQKGIARLITSESGLCLKDTLYEAKRVYNVLTLGANAISKIEEDTTSRYVDGRNENPKLRVITEPLDLVLAITPFNHPMNQVAHKIIPAVMAGTSVVLKPTEKTPLSAIKFVEILLESGLEPNYINLITSNYPKEFLDHALSTHLAQLVTFTGG